MSAVRALAPQVPLQLPVKLLPMLEPRRFKVLHGGRGGAKSHTVAQLLIMLSMQRRLRILCVRQIQKSIRQSSMQVLKDYIEGLGVGAYFDVLKTEIRCLSTGSTFEFSGLQDHTATSIKSFEGVDIVWAEEAHSISANAWNILIPTIRKAGSEIWITFNPDQESDYVYDRFVKHTDPDALVIKINHADNPWFGREMDDERRKLKALNDDLYRHVWEGECRSAAGLLFKRIWFKRYDLGNQPDVLNKYLASDYAVTDVNAEDVTAEPDWTEHGMWGMDQNGDLWAVDWWSGQTDPHVWIQAWLALIRRHGPLRAFEEKGVIKRSQDGAINRAMREAQTFVRREGLLSAGNKASRALGFAARAAAGTVWIPNTDWGDRLVNQLCAFNGQDGRTDDMVDVCSLLARGLDLMWAAAKPEPAERSRGPEPFTAPWLDQFDQDEQFNEAQRANFYR